MLRIFEIAVLPFLGAGIARLLQILTHSLGAGERSRSAVRAVRGELRQIVENVKTPRWDRLEDLFPHVEWEKHRRALGELLSDERYNTVERAYVCAQAARIHAGEQSTLGLQDAADAATKAVGALDQHQRDVDARAERDFVPRISRPAVRWRWILGGALLGLVTATWGLDALPSRQGKDLVIYSSLPTHGPHRGQTGAIVNGMNLALQQSKGKAGKFTVTHRFRENSTARSDGTEPALVQENARHAANDSRTAAYVGEYSSGDTALSIPILSAAKVAQISPTSTRVGLTSNEPGAEPGEPGRYYVGGFRNFVRVVPRDSVQAEALVTIMKKERCGRVAMANDALLYGEGLARNIELAARARGRKVLFNHTIRASVRRHRALTERIAKVKADCFVYAGTNSRAAVRVFTQVAGVLDGRLYGPDGVAEDTFTDDVLRGIPPRVADRTRITTPTLDRGEYGEAGEQFFAAYAKHYGIRRPDSYAIYGYEAMALALDAIKRSDGSRKDIVSELFDTENRDSVLGRYGINDNGDTSLRDYGLYGIQQGKLVWREKITVP
jgi:branched-chain amino acid transport system substrate-binding protein